MSDRSRCECTRSSDDRPCASAGTFLVGIGSRQLDRQWSCSRHLAETVIRFTGAEGGPGTGVTVQWYPNGAAQ